MERFFSHTNLTGAALEGADLTNSEFDKVLLGDNDLSSTLGLETISHRGPSQISAVVAGSSPWMLRPLASRAALRGRSRVRVIR